MDMYTFLSFPTDFFLNVYYYIWRMKFHENKNLENVLSCGLDLKIEPANDSMLVGLQAARGAGSSSRIVQGMCVCAREHVSI